MTSQEDYDKIVRQFQNLQETYEELLSYKVIAQKEDLKRYGVTGWDAGRICFLARACCEMGYISETDAWKYIDIAYNTCRVLFVGRHGHELYYRTFLMGRQGRIQFCNEKYCR